MESFGICLALPFGLVVSLLYAWATTAFVWRWLRIVMLIPSLFVAVGLLIEWTLLATLGAVGARQKLGGSFELLHFVSFVLGTGALINLWMLPWFKPTKLRSISAGIAGGFLFFVLVIQQYVVFEALYGINGDGGPFSEHPMTTSP